MRLHGNAALSWNGRRVLARRVVVDGWTLVAAAEAAGVSVRCARKWVARYRQVGERGLLDRSSAPFHGCRDRRDARDGALDGLGDPDPDRAGQVVRGFLCIRLVRPAGS